MIREGEKEREGQRDDKGEKERGNSAALWPRWLADQLLVNERILRDFFSRLRCTAGCHKEATRRPQSARGEPVSLYCCTDNSCFLNGEREKTIAEPSTSETEKESKLTFKNQAHVHFLVNISVVYHNCKHPNWLN